MATGEPDFNTVWMARDKADGLYLTEKGGWSSRANAGKWAAPEMAMRALLTFDGDRYGGVEFIRQGRTIPAPTAFTDVTARPWLNLYASWNDKNLQIADMLAESNGIDPMSIPAVVEVFAELRGPVARIG